jgi:hypothetical protein
MGLLARGWVVARSVSRTIFMEHSLPGKRRLCRLEDFSLPLQWRVNPFTLPSPWTLMIRPALVMEYLPPKKEAPSQEEEEAETGGQFRC